MELILFSKFLKECNIPQLIQKAHELKIDGYDLAVRPGYVVNPDNSESMLPQLVEECKKENIVVPMVTARGDLLVPSDPDVEPLLEAMDKADVRLIKLGYFQFKPSKQADYWVEVDRIRKIFEAWQDVSRKYNVKICYHTHSNYCMGLNCAAIMHLLRGFDPKCMGAYIDAGHLVAEGEAFDLGVAMVKDYLSIVALKDVLTEWDEANDKPKRHWKKAGQGVADWNLVFSELVRIGFDGPLSVHAEYEKSSEQEFLEALPKEVAFFREKLESAQKK